MPRYSAPSSAWYGRWVKETRSSSGFLQRLFGVQLVVERLQTNAEFVGRSRFAAAVAFVGISNQLSKFGTSDIPQELYNVHSRAWPWEDWMWMLERSPVFHADKTRTPLLILAGDKDPRVHPSQSIEMYRHVKLRTETPVRLVFYPGEKHGNKHTAAQFDYALRFERWMSYYLVGTGDSIPPYEIDHAARMEK